MIIIHYCRNCHRYWKCWDKNCPASLFVFCPKCMGVKKTIQYLNKLETILETL